MMKIDWTRYDALEYFEDLGKEANPFYQTIFELDKRLSEANIPHVLRRFLDGWQILYPSEENRAGDIISHFGAYGHEQDLLEAYGFDLRDVRGWLSVDDAFDLIKSFDAKRRTTQ